MDKKEIPADVRRLIDEALRLEKAERKRQAPMVPIEKEFDGESGLANLVEALREAGIVPGAKQAVEPPKGEGKKATVNQRMAEVVFADPAVVSWTAANWAQKLGCSATAVKLTATWKAIQATRIMLKVERTERGR